MKRIHNKNAENPQRASSRNPLWIVLGVTLIAGVGATLSACNTVEGVGRDVESAGDSLADTADDAKD